MQAKVFISPGNHDFFCEKSPYSYLDFPENVHIFRSPSVRCIELPELGCRIWGAGMNAPFSPPLLRGFSVMDKSLTDIMVMHADLTGGSYNPVTEDDIALSKLDYAAFGHVHSFSGIKKAGGTFYAYPGCPEGRGFDETGEKGVILGEVGQCSCDLRFVPLGGREYKVLSIDAADTDDIASHVLGALPSDIDRDICRIVLSGEYSGKIDKAYLAELCSARCFSAEVRDKTSLPHNIWTDAGSDNLTGLFVSRMREKYDTAANEDERRGIELAVKYGLAALENREEWMP